MKSAKKIYKALCWAADLETAVAKLSNKQLRELNHYLNQCGARRGIPALIQGLLLHEAAGRLMIQKDAKDHP